MSEVWPWLALAGLGVFHGVNPAMGWLFAVALGMQQRSHAVVVLALIPIAVGHAAAVAIVVFAVLALGILIDERAIRIAAGGVLIAWAFRQWLFGARHRVRFGMQVGMIGLAIWSLLMATAHGAGLMLVPVLDSLVSQPDARPGIDGERFLVDRVGRSRRAHILHARDHLSGCRSSL